MRGLYGDAAAASPEGVGITGPTVLRNSMIQDSAMSDPIAELPASVRVGPFDFKIMPMDMHAAASHQRYGECSSLELTIRVQTQFAHPIKAVDTVLHEIGHAIFWVYGIQDSDDEERTVASFGTGWAQVYRDTPDLLAWLAKWTAQA